MSYGKSNSIRLIYLSSIADGLHVTWPILSSLLMVQAGLGAIIGMIENWGIWQGIYFAFITGLTIGYGDLVPRQPLTQVLAVAIGFSGIALTGLVAALAVRALQATAIAHPRAEIATPEPR
jgi:hypothetical protein